MAGDEKPSTFAELASALAVIGALAGGAITFLTASGLADDLGAAYGVAVKNLIMSFAGFFAAVFGLVFLWYFESLGGGAEAAGSGLRGRFDGERARLSRYRAADDGYAQRLKAFLAWIDRFFDGDNLPSQRARILSEPAHVWTAAAYDRCLLLAFLYPVVVIFFCWTIAGHLGPAESALGLREANGWFRAGTTGSLVILGLSSSKFMRAVGLPKIFWGVACLSAITVAFDFAGAGAVAVSFASVVVLFAVSYRIGANAIAFTIAFAVLLAVVGAVASIFDFVVSVVVSVLVIVAGPLLVVFLSDKSKKEGWSGVFLGVFSGLMFALCLLSVGVLSMLGTAENIGWLDAETLLLILGLFTLVNATFDWLSLGLTRFLLRYGIEKGGYWPYALAIVDAIVASLLITILALAMAWSTDLFNFLAEQGGGEQARVLPPSRFYLGMLERDPAAPEFWWLYATLFSTMIPSVINLFIAGFSFLRTLPWSRNFVLSNMREGETMPVVARLISSSILTAQVALAWPLAIAAQVFLTYVVLWQIMPRLGLGILHLVETLGFV